MFHCSPPSSSPPPSSPQVLFLPFLGLQYVSFFYSIQSQRRYLELECATRFQLFDASVIVYPLVCSFYTYIIDVLAIEQHKCVCITLLSILLDGF